MKASQEPRSDAKWSRHLFVPTRFELALAYIWLGSFLVLGSDATIPQVLETTSGRSPAFWFEMAWLLIPALLLIGALLRLLMTLSRKGVIVSRSHRLRWAEALAVAGAMAVLLFTDLDLMARVQLSEAALLGHVQDSESWSEWQLERSARVGLFTVYRTYRKNGVVIMETVLYGRPVGGGLVYCREGSPPACGENEYRYLYGPWWGWRYDM